MKLHLSALILSFAFFLSFTSAEIHGANAHAQRHHDIARRASDDVFLRRQENTGIRATWYDVGLGACGLTSAPGDSIVAISHWNFYNTSWPDPICFREIVISYGGKSTRAQIVDMCQACPEDGLDMSQGLFSEFADLGVGVIYVDWEYATPTTSITPIHTSTYIPPPPPTTTSKSSTPPPPPPPSTSTSKPPPPPPPSSYIHPPPKTSSTSSWIKPTSTASKPSTSITSTRTSTTRTSSSSSSSKFSTSTVTSTIYTTSVDFQAGPVANVAEVAGVDNENLVQSNVKNLNEAIIYLGALVQVAAQSPGTESD